MLFDPPSRVLPKFCISLSIVFLMFYMQTSAVECHELYLLVQKEFGYWEILRKMNLQEIYHWLLPNSGDNLVRCFRFGGFFFGSQLIGILGCFQSQYFSEARRSLWHALRNFFLKDCLLKLTRGLKKSQWLLLGTTMVTIEKTLTS